MGKVHDQQALDNYRYVLLQLGHVNGYVVWRALPRAWLDNEIPGCTQREINTLMMDHVLNGGEIHQVVETRPEYTEYRFHYDLRLPVSGRRIYIETIFLSERDPEDSTIVVVNMHSA